MLQIVPAVGTQGEFVDRRQVPEPGGRGEEQPGRHRVRQASRRSGEARPSARAERPSRCESAAASPRSSGNSGAPSQSSGGATIISSRCCSMWTCSSSDANGRSATPGPGRAPSSRPGKRPAGSAATPLRRGDGARASRAGRRPAVSRSADEKPRLERPGAQKGVERGVHRDARCRHGRAIAAGRAGSLTRRAQADQELDQRASSRPA